MPDINVLIKPASGMCNLRCSYCFYHDETKNREVESYGFMEEATLEQVIYKALEYADAACTFTYQGGEPMLRGLDFFRKSIEYEKKYNEKGIHIQNAIQTNGTLLNEEWAAFFKEQDFLVGISLDGTAFTHDSFRTDSQGAGTFERVLQNISLLKKYGVEYNVLTVVNALTAKKASHIYEFYKQQGFSYLQFIPCLNPLEKQQERFPFTLTSKAYGQFLKTLFDLWYQDLKKGHIVHIQPLEGYIKLLLRMPPDLCGMSGICSYQHVVEADGEVYPCDFYVLDQYRLGNLTECSFAEIQERRKETGFVESSLEGLERCRECKYFPLCRGGCKRHRSSKNSFPNYFCEAYYEFFEYSIARLEEAAGRYGAALCRQP